MAFDSKLAGRIRKMFSARKTVVSEKKMFGGLSFLVKDKMCCGVLDEKLVARVGPDQYEKALRKSGVKPMDFTGRPLKGFVYVEASGVKSEKSLEYWIKISTDYVSRIKETKKRR